MNELLDEPWVEHIQAIASEFSYPATPEIGPEVYRQLTAGAGRAWRRTRLTWGLAVLVTLLALILAVPPVRAAILDFIQIGVVRIFPARPGGTASPILTPTGQLSPTPQGTPSPVPTATLLPSLSDLAGRTTLEQAQQKLDFPIRLPTFPSGIGPPDDVFLQVQGGEVLVMVWLQPDDPTKIWFSLHEYGPNAIIAQKFSPQELQPVLVGGKQAYWTSGPYFLELTNGDFEQRRLIQGHVLIWEAGNITYRLETGEKLEQAVKMAESLH